MTTTIQLFDLSPEEEAFFRVLLETWGCNPTDINTVRVLIANFSMMTYLAGHEKGLSIGTEGLGEKWGKAFIEEDNTDSTTGS